MDSNQINNLFKKVAPVRIFEQAAGQIKLAINAGYFKPGHKLPTEQELSQQFNIGRSSIREALRVLEVEGVIELRRGQGVFVMSSLPKKRDLADVSQWLQQRQETLEQVLQVRESIEGLAAALAASRSSQQGIEKIRAALQEQERQIDNLSRNNDDEDYDTLSQLDAEFHLAISSFSGNDIVHEIVTHIVPPFNESNKAVLYYSKRMHQMLEEHLKILHAIEAQDPVLAEQTIREHISNVRKIILTLAERSPLGY